MALVFWKDSLDFNRIIKKQMDQVEPKAATAYAGSPDRKRAATLKKNTDEAITQYKQQLGKGGQ